MLLSQLKTEVTTHGIKATWLVDNHTMWVHYTGLERLPFAADMALISCLVPAMQLHQDIALDESFRISKDLLANIERFQFIYSSWFSALRPAAISVATTELSQVATKKVASFFSGGVDATYTFLTEKEQISTLFFCVGLDIQLHETERLTKSCAEARKFSTVFNKELCIVETNFREIFPNDSHFYSQVSVLIGFALGVGFQRLLVPASHLPSQLEPFGSHPMTDPLLSNGYTEVIHHGMAPRTLKTRIIAEFPAALDVLRVCNASAEYNCGICEKCLRTITTLAVYDRTSPRLPPLVDLKQLNRVKLWDDAHYLLWKNIADEAQKAGKTHLNKEAERICRSYRYRKILKSLIAELKLLLRFNASPERT